MATPAPYFADEILEEIFLRLPTPAALARASTACPRFHHIITHRSFLRRYRKLHPPPLLGFIDDNGFQPAQAPHPSAPLARALADAADFTYSFVPDPTNADAWAWQACDGRDGRVLLLSVGSTEFPEIAVCDPLSRRYVLLPPIPEDLAVQGEELVETVLMLAPIGEDETSFKVICPAHYKGKLVAFVFSSVTGNWSIAASLGWSSLSTDEPEYGLADCNHRNGCFYWTNLWWEKVLVLDTRSMEFSAISSYGPQIGQSRCESYIVAGGGDQALEMFSLVAGQGEQVPVAIHHTILQINADSSTEWRLEKIIQLTSYDNCFASGASEGLFFLGATTFREDELIIADCRLRIQVDFEDHYFSLEVQTYETTEIYRKDVYPIDEYKKVFWYFGFPPSLSKPTI